ncbi:hypothetical protein BDW62DRAFT_200790 [Aspergillus aurantiobrunneus]
MQLSTMMLPLALLASSAAAVTMNIRGGPDSSWTEVTIPLGRLQCTELPIPAGQVSVDVEDFTCIFFYQPDENCSGPVGGVGTAAPEETFEREARAAFCYAAYVL